MSLNRFFFRCGRCLFKFTADTEGFRAPSVPACPVCAREYVECMGATKGVLSLGVKCNDVCVFAEGPDCSCACAGANHGSRLLIPVLKGVVDFQTGRFPTLEAARREWEAWQAKVSALKGGLQDGSQARRHILAMLPTVYASKSWRNRHKEVAAMCAEFGLGAPVAAPVGELSGVLCASSFLQSNLF